MATPTTMPVAPSISPPVTRVIPYFPNEIAGKIFGNLEDKTDLKALRLASKGMNEYVKPLLYDEMHLSLSPQVLYNAEEILWHYPQHVRIISISPCMNEEMRKREYSGRVYRGYEGNALREWGWHIVTGYNNYAKETKDMQRVLVLPDLGDFLGRCLRELRNVRRVVLDATPRPKFPPQRLRSVCHDGWHPCRITPEEHKMLCLEPVVVPELMEAGSLVFANIFFGLADGVRELMMPVDSDSAIHLGVLDWREADMNNLCTAFSHLRKLRLNLKSTKAADFRAWNHRQPSFALRSASSLEVLMIKLEGLDLHRTPLGGTAFAMLFHRCRFPRLRNLYLENISATADDISELRLVAPNLQNLVIEDCTLHDGLWQNVAEVLGARRAHGLTTVSLNKLRRGFGAVAPMHLHELWYKSFGDWDRFYYEDGPNPFTPEKLGRYWWWRFNGDRPFTHFPKTMSHYCREWFA